MRRSEGRRSQGGAFLLVALTATVLAGTSLLLARIDGNRVLREREAEASTRALAQARRALIGWSVGGGLDGGGLEHVPGVLPFPDRSSDARGYDGRSDCVTEGLADRHLIGRVPWAGEAAPCPGRTLGVELRDGSGEPLWYAVSRNLVNHRGGAMPDPPINPGLLDTEPAWPWIRLIDAHGRVVKGGDGEPLEVAAVIIAPGPPLPGQARNGIAPGAMHYLDAVTVNGVTYDNADSNGCRDRVAGASAPSDCPGQTGEEFILYPDSRDTVDGTDAFNDRIAYITVEELLRVAEARALGAMAVVLEQYRTRHGAYPWVAPRVGDPAADPAGTVLHHASVDGAGGTRRGMLPLHAASGQLYDTNYTLRWTIDAGASIAVTEASTLGSTPPPTDDELYALASGVPHTTGEPAECVWNGDDGVRCAGEPYRFAPGASFTRSGSILREREVVVEHNVAQWDFAGGSGVVATPPTASSPRTRAVTVTANLPASFGIRVRGRNYETVCLDSACTDIATTAMSVERTLVADTGTLATFTFSDLEYDLSPSRDGVPNWFVDNDWHRYVHVVVSGRETGAGDSSPGVCISAGSGCLTLHASGVARTDVPAFLIGSGPALPGQDRAACTDGCLEAYFEPPDNSLGADAATRAPLAADFNDQIRVVGPAGTSP